MSDRIIRLVTPDDIGVPDPKEKVYDSVIVIRDEYSDELMAYFVRSKTGVLLFVNVLYSTQDQAKAISVIAREIDKCGTVEAGVLKKDFKYFCGGSCCSNRYNPAI